MASLARGGWSPTGGGAAAASPPPAPVHVDSGVGPDAELKAELRFLAQKQRSRLGSLREDADSRMKFYAGLKKQELELRRSRALDALAELGPRLQQVRSQWSDLRTESATHEDRYRKLADRYQATQTRLKVLQDAIEGAQANSGEGRTGVAAMRSHLEEVSRDKQELRGKIKRALDCLLVDENMLKSRLAEEKDYAQQLRDMVGAVDQELAGRVDSGDVSVRELEESLTVVDERLVEMKQTTGELYDRYLQSTQSLQQVQSDVLLAIGEATTELAYNQEMKEYKEHSARVMQAQVDWFTQQGASAVNYSQLQDREPWFESKVEVLTEVLREMQALTERRQVRDKDSAALAETSHRCNQAKSQLQAVEQRVNGKDKYRRKLVDEITDMRQLLNEKLHAEEIGLAQLDVLLNDLGEDPAQVHELIEAEGFDNYVSSESGGEEATGEFVRLEEEGTHDVSAITTSLEFDPEDPAGAEALHRHAHRRQGPLSDFRELRAVQLAQRPHRKLGIGVIGSQRRRPVTINSVLHDAQAHAVAEVVAFVRMKQQRIASGLYDPKDDQILPDPLQREREDHIRAQVESWKAEQRGGGSAARVDAGGGAAGPSGGLVGTTDAALQAGSQDENAVAYLQRAVTGFAALMFFSGPVGPFQRQVFLTKDLHRLAWRRPPADVTPGTEGHTEESIMISDMRTVVTGHRTEVFREHRERGQAPMREAAALSVITAQRTSVDLEFDRAEERDYWAQILSTLASETKPGGAILGVIAAGRIAVHDGSSQDQRTNTGEPFDRRHLTLSLV